MEIDTSQKSSRQAEFEHSLTESCDSPGIPSDSVFSMGLLMMVPVYLFLLSIVPNAFGMGIILLCFISSTFRKVLLEPWSQENGAFLFNACCWKIQCIAELLIGPVFGGISFMFWQLSRWTQLQMITLGTILLSAPTAYLFAIFGSKARDWLNTMLLTSELRVEIVALVVGIAVVVSWSLARQAVTSKYVRLEDYC